MKNIFLFILMLSATINMCRAEDLDKLLSELDRKVSERQLYMDIKERRIDSLRNLIKPNLSPERRYQINDRIYREYSTYRYDSAMNYVLKNRHIAYELNNQKYKDEVTIATSMLLSTTGMYLESLDNLSTINRTGLDSSLLLEYYSITEWTYYAAGEYSNDDVYTPLYRQMEGLFRDSVFMSLPLGTPRYTYYKGKILLHERKLDEALLVFLELYKRIPIDTRLYAIVTYDISTIYREKSNMDMYETFLVLASISDQVCPLKENYAMQMLALYLYTNKPNDLERANKYIQCSMEDARFYNNRLRMIQISEKLPVIVKAYQQKSEQENKRLTLTLILISVLSLLTLILSFYLYKQIRLVQKNRSTLKNLNNELSTLNQSLHDANQTKEEYIGLFIDLSSTYIDKLDKYREMIKRKIVAKQIDDLYKMVNSTRSIDTELKDFFHLFDTAFLKLYPTFIDDFNKLLLPEDKVYPKKGELLNRELRIFALIRLGINDSSKIAEFMRYSPQTVYNNRTKVRNKAIDREDFENDVMKIGNFK